MSVPNEVFTVFSFIGFLMCCIPLPWHLEAWNTGTCLYMLWAGLGCLNEFINSIVWNHNAILRAPIWCDISARLIVGLAVALPAASLCINRRLYHIAAVRTVTVTKAEKHRAIMVDLAIGLGLPILEMILQYIPQGHRFDILEDIGCYPFTYNTPVALALVSVPPIVIGCISGVYAILSIRAFAKTRSQFKEVLSGNSNLNTNRYVRLMMLASIEAFFTVPLGIWALAINIKIGVEPWKGWADTHFGFSRIDLVPAILWRSTTMGEVSVELTRFFTILCAFIFFAFFGFAEEARKNYRSAVQSVAKRVGVSTGSSSTSSSFFNSQGSKSKNTNASSGGQVASLPVFVERRVVRKHDSLDSLSDMSASFGDVGGFLDEKKEKLQISTEHLSYDAIVLPDIGGALADYKDAPYSPAPSSGSSSASSISDMAPSPITPEPVVTRPDSSFIEISSVRHLSVIAGPDSLTMPELVHDASHSRRTSDTSPV